MAVAVHLLTTHLVVVVDDVVCNAWHEMQLSCLAVRSAVCLMLDAKERKIDASPCICACEEDTQDSNVWFIRFPFLYLLTAFIMGLSAVDLYMALRIATLSQSFQVPTRLTAGINRLFVLGLQIVHYQKRQNIFLIKSICTNCFV